MKFTPIFQISVFGVAIASTIAAATCYRETLVGQACTLAGYTPPTNACVGPTVVQNDPVYVTSSGSGQYLAGKEETYEYSPVCHVTWKTKGDGYLSPCNKVHNF